MNKLIDLLQPYNIGSKLIRLGKLDDGGYVLPELVLDTCETLYTFGLGDECSFKKDFNQRYKKPIKIFDYGSVFKPNIENTEIIKKNLQTVCNQTGDTIEHAVLTNNDVDKKLIFAEDVSSGLTFTIDTLSTGVLAAHQGTYGLIGNVSYVPLTNTTGYFRMYYNDPDNTQWVACLEVIKGSEGEVVCSCASNQVTSESAIITCSVNQSEGIETYYASAIFEGGSVPWRWIAKIGQTTSIDWGVTGYIIAMFLVFTSYFLFSKMPSFAVLISTGVFVLCGLFGLIFKSNLGKFDIGVYTLLLVIAYLIFKIKSDSSGLEGS